MTPEAGKEFKHTKEMGEISGFGGGYEEACQTMLDRGVRWLLLNPNKKPAIKEYTNLYGVLADENSDAEELSKVITEGLDVTGAMHQTVMTRLMFICDNGWNRYCEELVKSNANEE